MKKTTRFIAILMALAVLAGLCACNRQGNNGGGGGNSSDGGASPTDGGNQLAGVPKVRLEHVYTMQYLDTAMGENNYIQQTTSVGDSVYLTMNYDNSYFDEEKQEYFNDYGTKLLKLDPETGAMTDIFSFPQTSTYDEETETSTYVYVNQVVPCKDGSFWYYKEETTENWSDPENYIYESKSGLVHAAADGTELIYLDKSALTEQEYFWAQSISPLDDGGLLILTGDEIIGLGPDGEKRFSKPLSGLEGDSWINSFARTGNGLLVAVKYTYDPVSYRSSNVLISFDPLTGDTTDLGELPMANSSQIYDGPGDCVLMNTPSSIYSYDVNTKELKELLNWLNSDVNANRINNITALADGRFVVTEWDRDYGTMRFAILTGNDEVIEKYVVNFAAVYLDDELRDAMIRFNKQNSEFRIQFVDYSIYNTNDKYNGGVEKLNHDIISGQIPDIFSMNGLPYDVYASKGLLADLGKLMENDPEFDRSLFLENIFDATEMNGKLYSVIPSFSLMTAVGRSDLVGGTPGWTIEDLIALRKKMPEASVFGDEMTRSTVLYYVSSLAMDSYIDAETGDCHFNDPSFIQLLELIGSFPETIDWDVFYKDKGQEYWNQQETALRDGRTLIQMQHFGSYEDIKYIARNFQDTDFTLVGFPVPPKADGSKRIGASIQPQLEVGVSGRTKLTAVCWDFVKYLLSDDYQSSITWSFPVRLSCLEAMRTEATTDKRGEDGRVETMPIRVSTSEAVMIASGEVAAVDTTDEISLEDDVTADDVTADDTPADDVPADDALTDDTPADEAPEDGDSEDGDSGDTPASSGEIKPYPEPEYDDWWSRPVNEKDANKLDEALRTVHTVARDRNDVVAIIEEEAGAFFSGQKSAEAVAAIIQSRVQIFVSESR